MELININNITVPKYYKVPRPETMERKLKEINKDVKPIKLNKHNVLIDDYATYLIYKQKGITCVPAEYNTSKSNYKNSPTLYIYGHHPNNDKEYVWRATNNLIDYLDVIGHKVLVQTKYGKLSVTVTRTEVLDCPPVEHRVKKVIKVLEEKNAN